MEPTGGRRLISLTELSGEDLRALVRRTVTHAERKTAHRPLDGRIVGLYFALTSTRTRTAFTSGALRLGAQTVSYGSGDLQLNTGETAVDTGRVLATMLDAFVVRAAGDSAELRDFGVGGLPVINAMSADEHPTQALADLATIHQSFGAVDGVRVLYVGEGNSTAVALCHALSRYDGTVLHVRTPPSYGLPAAARNAAPGTGAGSRIDERANLDDLPDEVDVVYTTRWQTTGTMKRHDSWRELFDPFRVDTALLDLYPHAVFMHDLPAHRGDEVEAAVIDGPRSVVFRQAANKLYSAMAALEWCMTSW